MAQVLSSLIADGFFEGGNATVVMVFSSGNAQGAKICLKHSVLRPQELKPYH